MRLSPSLISGKYFCAITGKLSSWVSISRVEPILGLSAVRRKMPIPPMPSSGLTMTSWWVLIKSRIWVCLLVTIVGVISSGNCVANNFSLQSRTLSGLLTTNTPARWAYSSKYRLYKNCMSNGGSLRIKMTSNAVAGCVVFSPSS